MRRGNSEAYTEALRGKTIHSVDHRHYGDSFINFTDGTRARLSPSGTPATIFISVARVAQPLMARVLDRR